MEKRGTRGQVGYAVDREIQSISSVLRLTPADRRAMLQSELAPAIERLREFGRLQAARLPADQPRLKSDPEAAKLIVKRKRFGTIPLDDLPHDQWEGQPSGAWAAVPTLALYWCDGRRTLAEVEG